MNTVCGTVTWLVNIDVMKGQRFVKSLPSLEDINLFAVERVLTLVATMVSNKRICMLSKSIVL